MPDSSPDTADASTTQSDTDEFDVPDIDTADADRIRSVLDVRSLKPHFEEYPLGHDTEDTWWAEAIKHVLEALPGIDPPKGSGNFYLTKY